MEWREQSSVSSEEAFVEAQRWIEAVTKKTFGSRDFRSALENGVLLCDLINRIKPGLIKKVNRLPTPIAGLDNLNVFLKACGKLGLKEAQLFHPGDLQDLSSRVTVQDQESSRRLKNVVITVYWLGRRAQCEHLYDGPYLNFKAFEGLLGTALYKALQESSSQRGSSARDSGFGDNWSSEREEAEHPRGDGGGGHRRDDSLDSLDSLSSHNLSISSDTTLKGSSEGGCSDTEVDSALRMADNKDSLSYRRSITVTPKVSTQFNQFLPTKDKQPAYVPAPLRKKRAERNEDSRRSWANPVFTEEDGSLTSAQNFPPDHTVDPGPPQLWDYNSGSDSDVDRPDPDLVLDDLACRRFHSPSPAPPANFAVPISPGSGGHRDSLSKVTEPHNVVPQNVTSLSSEMVNPNHRPGVSHVSLFREGYDDSEDEDEDDVGYADPVQDDLYTRKIGLKPQPVNPTSYDKFLPKFWTPEEDVHIQKIKMGSKRRPWYKKMQGFSAQKSGSSSDDSDSDVVTRRSSGPSPSGPSPAHARKHEASARPSIVVGKRQRFMSENIDGSKSTSDIQGIRQEQMEELKKYREQIKQSDDKWQDDLSKWKSRRRSVNSDIVKKKEEREKIEQITFSGDNRRSKTFKEMQEERENRRNNSLGRLSSLHTDDEDVFEKPSAQPRSLPPRSSTIDTPYTTSDLAQREVKPVSPKAPSRRSLVSRSEEVDNPSAVAWSNTSLLRPRSSSPQLRSLTPENTSKVEETRTTITTSTVNSTRPVLREQVPRRPLSRVQTDPAPAPSTGSLYKQQPQYSSMEPKPPATSRVSASLPRPFQISDSTRLVTPRPFGMQSSRISSLPRTFSGDSVTRKVNGDVDAAKRSSVPSRYHQFMTPEDEEKSQSSSSSEDEEEREKSATVRPAPPQVERRAVVAPAPVKATTEDTCQMRISLNQKPNSNPDFGFQAAWDSTGARVTSIKPGSPAEIFQLHPGDEVLTVNGQQVAEMSYTAWKASMEEALQEGSLVMDVRRHGQKTWDRDQPSSPFQSHKTINLTSLEHPMLVGFPDANAVNSLDFTSRNSRESASSTWTPSHPVIDVASNGLNGGFREEPVNMRNKESETISLKNLKRRSEFFEKGGPDTPMPDIPVPAITPSSRWSWDPEEERRRQEKWQKEQERLLQEKYKRDQEKMQEEWLKAQQEIDRSSKLHQPGSLEMHSSSVSLLSSLSPVSQSWEEEERVRKEEQERQIQVEEERRWQEERERERREEQEKERRVEQEKERERREEQERQREVEERRRREEEQRQSQLLQEERRRKEQQEEERKEREAEELIWQQRREEEREAEERKRQAATEKLRREREVLQQQQQQWNAGSHFSNWESTLSISDRRKSKSSPQLDEDDRTQRGFHSSSLAHQLLEDQLRLSEYRHGQSLRTAELESERRNILNAMKYREPERVTGVAGVDRRSQQSLAPAELDRQQLLNDMKKKNSLLTDNSWIRQLSAAAAGTNPESDSPPMRRGESLDHLETSYNSWRSSWTPRSNAQIPNYSRPHSALSGVTSHYGGGSGARQGSPTMTSSNSLGSLRGSTGRHTPTWGHQSPSPSPSSPSPATSPEPPSEAGGSQRSRSVSGKKICTYCDTPLGKGAAMIIESLGLCYHLGCFKCIDCHTDLGGSEAGAEVRIRNKQLYCNFCYMRFKTGQPTSM